MMTMKQACELIERNRIAKAKKHMKEVRQGELCSGLTDKEWNQGTNKSKRCWIKRKEARSYCSVDLP